MSSGVIEEKRYPAALASHEDIVRDPWLFGQCLTNFHSALGTKVPVIGGKELNLHVLYAEVTKRGGYEKQLYFNKLQGPPSLPPTPQGPMTFEAIGTINAKIDCGYLVSVKLGSETLAGVLYHPDQPGSSKSVSRGCTDIIPYNPNTQRAGRRSRRRKRRGGGDPAHPKPNRSGYNFFFAKKHSELKSLYPYREREFTKMIGESWNNLSLEEKAVFQDYGLQDKERYQREMKEYKERGQMRQS
ncbi:hypothetical protein LguiA_006905 [Lonicera macranthoides]